MKFDKGHSLAHLSDQNQVRSSPGQSCDTSDACGVTHTQQQAFTHLCPLLFICELLQLQGTGAVNQHQHWTPENTVTAGNNTVRYCYDQNKPKMVALFNIQQNL